MRVFRTSARKLMNRNQVIRGNGVDDIVIQKKPEPELDFSYAVNPGGTKIGIANIDKKIPRTQVSEMYRPSALALNKDRIAGVNFKRPSGKPKKVKLNIV
jgi:hypothetical protein